MPGHALQKVLWCTCTSLSEVLCPLLQISPKELSHKNKVSLAILRPYEKEIYLCTQLHMSYLRLNEDNFVMLLQEC